MGKHKKMSEYIETYIQNLQHLRENLDESEIEARDDISEFGDEIEYVNKFPIDTEKIERMAQSMKSHHTEEKKNH